MGLIDVALLRSKAIAAGIAEITQSGNNVILHITAINTEVAAKLSAAFGNRFIITATEKPVYSVKLEKNQTVADLVKELSEEL